VTEETVQRVHYQERQILRAEDLEAEQAYRIAMRRRHNIAHHGWGIVTGLDLGIGDDKETLRIEPGMAVDGYGRELFVPQTYDVSWEILRSEELKGKKSEWVVDVWLIYARVPETPPQKGRWECGPGQHSRWREEAHIRLTRGGDEVPDPRHPPGVTSTDLDFGPYRAPPDDPAQAWPVFLGRVECKDVAGEGAVEETASPITVVSVTRPYVSLIGEAVLSPAGDVRMRVGSTQSGGEQQFSVSLRDDKDVWQDRLVIQREDTALLRGHLILVGEASQPANLRAEGIKFTQPVRLPDKAKPWQLYRTVLPQDESPVHQLRLEIAHPGNEDDPAYYQLVIGYHDGNPGFQPCLTVMADGTVRISGNLEITAGHIIRSPIQADPSDPRFVNAVLNNWIGGASTAADQMEFFYSGALQITVSDLSPTAVDGKFVYHINIRNTSKFILYNIRVTEVFRLNEKKYVSPISEPQLAPDETRTFERSHLSDDSRPKHINIYLTAEANSLWGHKVQASPFTVSLSIE
jgi:hypothetical protein